IMDDEAEIYRFWRIRKTIMHLCHDRGYIVTQDELDQTLEDFKLQFFSHPTQVSSYRSQLNLLVSHSKDTNNQMFVFFPEDEKVNFAVIKKYC
ncbi:hypothetical protein, partial [Salmonella sp. s54836]|uniref:hypothetical protein n=1 Tax=Salmonella sp. s54836 TaxID=3159673 RepID=UPI0039811BC0